MINKLMDCEITKAEFLEELKKSGYSFDESIKDVDKAVENCIKELIKNVGLDVFSRDTQEYLADVCVDKEFFEKYQVEFNKKYIDEIRHKKEATLDGELKTRLELEIARVNCVDEEDFLNYLCDNDAIEWFKESFGYEEYIEVIKFNKLLDVESVAQYVIDCIE